VSKAFLIVSLLGKALSSHSILATENHLAHKGCDGRQMTVAIRLVSLLVPQQYFLKKFLSHDLRMEKSAILLSMSVVLVRLKPLSSEA